MKNKTKIINFFLIFLLLISFSGCGCKKQTGVSYEMDLEIWGVFDDQDDYSEIFENYKELNPQINQITFRKLSVDTYKQDLLEALAAGKGPDIFLIQNNWLPSFQNKLIASPTQIVSEKMVEQELADTVKDDFVSNGEVYALPLSVDSLALFYNKDILNRSGIAIPPITWDEFQQDVQKMTDVDQFGNITQSGAALGTAYNINRSTDILSSLFFQNGVDIDDKTSNSFAVNISGSQAEKALKFYTQFSNSSSDYYSWSSRQHYSLDAFAEGTLAMMLNYSWQIETLKSKSPKLNFGIAPLPQENANQEITFSNYWGYAVAGNKNITENADSEKRAPTQTERVQEAWNFLKYLAFSPTTVFGTTQTVSGETLIDPAEMYLEKTRKPAARRDLIEKQSGDSELGVFALGNLYARSFLQYDPERTEAVLAEAIDQVVKGEVTYREALVSAQSKINKLVSQ